MSLADKAATVNGNNATILTNVDKVYEAGKKAEYDAFWDSCQQNGQRTNYDSAFYGRSWTPVTFKPKYDMKPTTAISMFQSTANLTGSLPELLNSLGITLSFENATKTGGVFSGCGFTEIGEVYLPKVGLSYHGSMFQNAKSLVRIQRLYIQNANIGTSVFSGCTNLEEVTFEGSIAYSLSLSPCTKLSHDSIMSFINALISTTSTSKKITLGSALIEKLTEDELAQIEAKGWTYA